MKNRRNNTVGEVLFLWAKPELNVDTSPELESLPMQRLLSWWQSSVKLIKASKEVKENIKKEKRKTITV